MSVSDSQNHLIVSVYLLTETLYWLVT